MNAPADVKDVLREKYGQAALRVKFGQGGCCGSAPSAIDCCDPITSNLYDAGQAGDVPAAAMEIDGKFVSAFIRATKPAPCCAPSCCSR